MILVSRVPYIGKIKIKIMYSFKFYLKTPPGEKNVEISRFFNMVILHDRKLNAKLIEGHANLKSSIEH